MDQRGSALTNAVATVATVGVAAAGAVLAAADNVDTGLVIGAAGLLGLLFRYYFVENKRQSDEKWQITDEYRVERDYWRDHSAHYQARWLDVVQRAAGAAPVDIPPLPNLDQMKMEAQREKETPRGRRS